VKWVAAAAVALWIVRVRLGLEGDSLPSILMGLVVFSFYVASVLLLVVMPLLLAYAILVEPDSARLDRRLRELRLGHLHEEDDDR
jgi:hypothetical protein